MLSLESEKILEAGKGGHNWLKYFLKEYAPPQNIYSSALIPTRSHVILLENIDITVVSKLKKTRQNGDGKPFDKITNSVGKGTARIQYQEPKPRISILEPKLI